jgi:hypothetical protein
MQSESFNLEFENKNYLINKSVYEYLVDEPPGGGKSILFRIEEGVAAKALLLLTDITINSRFLEYLLKGNFLIFEFEYHRIWGVGTTDVYYMSLVKDNKNENFFKCGMSELHGQISLKPKF